MIFDKWFKTFEPFVEEAYEDYKQSRSARPALTYFQFAFTLYIETKYADSLALN